MFLCLPHRPSHASPCTCVKAHESTWLICAALQTKNTLTDGGKYFHLDKTSLRCFVYWHHAEWEKIPGCIALVIFSSNRTGYHPRSQPCWGVCAPFRTDLNKTWKIDTEPAAMYEYQCHLWQSRMEAWKISIHYEFSIETNYFSLNIAMIWCFCFLLFFVSIPMGRTRLNMSDNEVVFTKHCNQYTILPRQTLKDDHTKQDVTPEDFE